VVARTPVTNSQHGNPLVAIGGIPTVLFAFGVFLVIVFTSLPIIGGSGKSSATNIRCRGRGSLK